MDSRLLNVFHDDPFDGNYTKYEQQPSYWSNDSDSMDMQLTETLQGILPIAATDDEDANIVFGNAFLKEHEDISGSLTTQRNALIYNDFVEPQFNVGHNIRILTVDPEADCFDSDDVDDNDDLSANAFVNGISADKFDTQSQCSNLTFRSRTDSSSIADYESHSSDYDEDDVKESKKEQQSEHKPFEEFINLADNILPPDDFVLDTTFKVATGCTNKNRTFSTNTNGSDVDGLGVHIDANNFDLAEFITQDDFALSVHTNTSTIEENEAVSISNATPTKIVKSSFVEITNSAINTESDYESDVIVDVETVEFDEIKTETVWSSENTIVDEENVAFDDNFNTDPSWCPKRVKKIESTPKEVKTQVSASAVVPASTVSQQKSGRNICLVPNKKQCEFLKRKLGAGRNKVTVSAASNKTSKNVQVTTTTHTKSKIHSSAVTPRMIGMGKGGKNLALLKHELVSISGHSSEENTTPGKHAYIVDTQQHVKHVSSKESIPIVKKKLNLAEYKKRRGEGVSCMTSSAISPKKQLKLDNVSTTQTKNTPFVCTKPQTPKTTPVKHNEAITSIVQSLKTPKGQKAITDPITEAKNKVLRMQQLKRAQQLKILDSTVSAKVPLVTKLPPLKEIVKDTYCVERAEHKHFAAVSNRTNSDYESIVIVSASCNTDLTIPPFDGENGTISKCPSRSLLKSSALLYNISDSFKKVQQSSDKPKSLNNSLIASIQNEVVKKSLPSVESNIQNSCLQMSNANDTKIDLKQPHEPHGEDKIIMYLSKNRPRTRTINVSTQTELQPEFPLLTLLKSVTSTTPARKSRERRRQKTQRNYRKRDCSSSSMSSTSSVASDLSQSSGHSADRLRNSDTTAAGGYSSRSTRRHRSSVSSSFSEAEQYERSRRQRRTSYNKRRSKKHSRLNTSSCSGSSSQSDYSGRERSRSPLYQRSRSNSRTKYNKRRMFNDRNVSQPAVEERRIVYVGRIEQETTKDILRRKFIQYGTIKQITIHYKETGMKYGFVTFDRAQDAFKAIDSSPKDPQINMYDISFGGRRAFCRASYADLDNAGINNYQSYVFPKAAPQPKDDDSFEALLLKVKAKLNANKLSGETSPASANPVVKESKI